MKLPFIDASQDNNYYVYALTENGTIFYIGITHLPVFRYTQHISDGLCRGHIYNMRLKKETPGLIILGIFPDVKQAEAAEHSLIRICAINNNKLYNKDQNPLNNRIPTKNINKSFKPKRMPNNTAKRLFEQALTDYKNHIL